MSWSDTRTLPDGRQISITVERDDDSGPPWEEHDGHGIVSEWTARKKASGERILCSDHTRRRYYNVVATLELARKAKWGCPHAVSHEALIEARHTTRREEIACAVNADFEYLRTWCNDEWEWQQVEVRLLDAEGKPTRHRASLGGIEDPDGTYIDTVIEELIAELPTVEELQIEAQREQLALNG